VIAAERTGLNGDETGSVVVVSVVVVVVHVYASAYESVHADDEREFVQVLFLFVQIQTQQRPPRQHQP
jgi:NADH:ubiquinone oxidoreductase subunit 5 (subunit L)/multisubunit Na+/H+ antiporter MnhA subunit